MKKLLQFDGLLSWVELCIPVTLFFLITFSFISCQNIIDMQINRDPHQIKPMQETKNIDFIKSWKRWDITESPRLYDYSLSEIEKINGIPCIKRITLDSFGDLYSYLLGTDFELNGSMIPAGSRYEARVGRAGQRTGYMIFLPKPIDIQGYHVRDEAGMEDYKIDFYNDGSLKDFKIYEDIEINNIPCKGGKKSGISLYPDGSLWICNLSKNIEIDGSQFKEGDRILKDTSGRIFHYSSDLYLKIMSEIGIF